MYTLRNGIVELVEETAPPLIDLAQLERLVTADELQIFDGDCTEHDGCRPVFDRRNS